MKEIKIYKAIDGTEFDDKAKCEEHEKLIFEKIKKKDEEKAKKLADYERLKSMRIDEADGEFPITETDINPDMWYFTWFKVKNQEELDFLCEFVEYSSNKCVTEFPQYVCVETNEYDRGEFLSSTEDMEGQYMISFEACMKGTEGFFNAFGYEVDFRKVREIC